jgi:Caspase domain
MIDAVRRGLVVGVADYGSGSLPGCVDDARAVAQLLRRHHDGERNFDIEQLTGTVTKSALRERIEQLFRQPADVALLYFSGHGTENDIGGYLVTSDARAYDDALPVDDVLKYATRATAYIDEVVIILDCCHAGWLGTMPGAGNDGQAWLRQGLSILAASRPSEPALAIDDRSIFTTLLCGALEGGAADLLGNVSVAGAYAYIDRALGAWDQRPLFKSNVSGVLCLRKARRAIDTAILRQLPEWFSSPDATFPLAPRHEPEAEPHDPEAERIFARLQRCNRVGLVEPVGEEHMYRAAMHETGCRLTELGRFYWTLADKGRI